MSTYTHTSIETPIMFQLKGGLFPLTALQLQGTDLLLFEEQLTKKIQQAPKFFHNAPVVIDLQKLPSPEVKIDFKRLIDILIHKRLIPVGVKGGQPEHMAAATQAGLPTLQEGGKDVPKVDKSDKAEKSEHDNKKASVTHKGTENNKEVEQAVRGSNTRIITETVRSGQQIYARGGDLIVLAPVSHGSELLADGNIHVYGSLRGRALAGVTGDQNAHIFCHKLEAELVSIAGQYKISEDIDPTEWRIAVDISLVEGRLQIRPL